MANQEMSSKDINQLNYRPHLEYIPDLIHADDYISANTDQTSQSNSSIAAPSIKNLWADAVDLKNKIDMLEQTLSFKLRDISVPITDIKLTKGLQALGLSGDTIPFSSYKSLLEQPSSPYAYQIIEAFENYQADVNGTLNAELYPDIAEMKQDWAQMDDFIKRGLFAQVVSGADVNDINKVHAAEQALLNNYDVATRAKASSLYLLQSKYLVSSQSDEYYQASKYFEDAQDALGPIERKVHTRADVISLVDSKIVDNRLTIGLLSNTVDYTPYKKNLYEILYNLLKQYASRQDLEKGLRKIQALLKLSIDNKIENTNNTKHNLRNMANLPNKKKMNDALVNGVHLRNEVYGDVYDFMQALTEYPDNVAFHALAGHIADSVEYADNAYEQQSSDFYKMHSMDNELRTNKLRSLIDKDAAREVYKVIDILLSYAKQRNSWPEQNNLSQWLQDFLQVNNLS